MADNLPPADSELVSSNSQQTVGRRFKLLGDCRADVPARVNSAVVAVFSMTDVIFIWLSYQY